LDHNPYDAPTVDVADAPAATDQRELAGKGRRFLNLIIDSFCYYFAVLLVSFAMAIANPSLLENSLLGALVSLGTMLCYYVGFEVLFGRTIGKLLTGTRVVTLSGARPRFGQVVIRSLSRMVPFEPFSCLSDPPVGWHDQWSGTRVVRNTPGNSLGPAYALHSSDDAPPATGTLGLR